MTLFLTYGAPDPQTGQNPNWEAFGYPGPDLGAAAGAEAARADRAGGLERDARGRRLHRRLGRGRRRGRRRRSPSAGLKVVVLEAAGYYNESDFAQLELKAYQEMFWRGGPTPTADGNVSCRPAPRSAAARRSTGPTACAPRRWVREQWASEHGLEGVDGPDFDRHLDAVWERIGANDALQRPQRAAAADARGRRGAGLELRDDRPQHRPRLLRPGDRRLPRLRRPVGLQAVARPKTWLADAARARRRGSSPHARRAGARRGRPRGRGRGGRGDARRTARARSPSARRASSSPAASLESPALLLRSGIGGPAAGDNLRLHPRTRGRRRLRRATSRPGGARRRPGCATSSPTPARATAS